MEPVGYHWEKKSKHLYPLHTACDEGDIQKVGELLKSATVDVNQQDAAGYTPLHTTLTSLNHMEEEREDSAHMYEVLRLLCAQEGIDFTRRTRGAKDTPLDIALYNKNYKGARVLIASGKMSPIQQLLVAAQMGDRALVEDAFKKGVAIEDRDDFGFTALMAACKAGVRNLPMIRFLVEEKGANHSAVDRFGWRVSDHSRFGHGRNNKVFEYLYSKGMRC